jgi:hypothetical protein
MAINTMSKLPLLGGAQMKIDAERLQKVNVKAWDLGQIFEHFTFNCWIYESYKLYQLIDQMTPQEKIDFNFDPKTINWDQMVNLYVYGM